jgi:methyl-accepting chemotaxis protein
MKFTSKIALLSVTSFVLILNLLGLALLFGHWTTGSIESLESGPIAALQASNELDQALVAIQHALESAVEVPAGDLQEKLSPHQKRFEALLDKAKATPALAARNEARRKAFSAYLAAIADVEDRLRRKEAVGTAQVAAVRERYAALFGLLREQARQDVTAVQEAAAKAVHAQDQLQTSVFISVIVSIAILLALSLWIGRSLQPLRKMIAVATEIAKGDLTKTIELQSGDELGQLAAAFSEMVKKLRQAYAGTQESAQKLAAAAAEILASAQEQEAAAQQQATAFDEFIHTVQSLLESATHISESAQGVLANAERAKQTSDLTASRIAELSAQAGRMGEILDIIRVIADRSDLLALNASLEGTRAGDAGKGFQLVAAEMRRLAERVTASVRDIKEMVAEVRASSSSTVLVTEESRKLADSTTASARQISLVTQQQRTATEQVAQSLSDASTVLTQSVTIITQLRDAVENLKSQADNLSQITSAFRVNGETKRQVA